jgi:hypothetical protein
LCSSVYCTCMVLIFYPLTQIFIISHKGTIFSQNKNSVSEVHFFFGYKNVTSKSFYQNKIHPFHLMLIAKKWNVIHIYTVRNLINNLISLSFCSQLFQPNGSKYKIQYYLKKRSGPYWISRNTCNFFCWIWWMILIVPIHSSKYFSIFKMHQPSW